jgi:hypothetical protein
VQIFLWKLFSEIMPIIIVQIGQLLRAKNSPTAKTRDQAGIYHVGQTTDNRVEVPFLQCSLSTPSFFVFLQQCHQSCGGLDLAKVAYLFWCDQQAQPI